MVTKDNNRKGTRKEMKPINCKYCFSNRISFASSYYDETAYDWKCDSCGKFLEDI